MDWLRKVPIGQYVTGDSSWLRSLDPRLKMLWVVMFLITPILAGPIWRLGLVVSLLLFTLLSCLPWRIWSRSFCFVLILSVFVGVFAILLPTGEAAASLSIRNPQELSTSLIKGPPWDLLTLGPIRLGEIIFGPFIINRRSAELALNTSTLIFTVVHSVNLMLLTTPPEDLVWTLRWFLAPLALFGLPVDRISFQLLLSLRFLPLVQEEVQNLLRSLAMRAVKVRKLGFKSTLALVVSVAERLLANILLRAEQGADALVARGGVWLPPSDLRPIRPSGQRLPFLNFWAGLFLIIVLSLRGKYGAL